MVVVIEKVIVINLHVNLIILKVVINPHHVKNVHHLLIKRILNQDNVVQQYVMIVHQNLIENHVNLNLNHYQHHHGVVK
jgi:hypothetical protein